MSYGSQEHGTDRESRGFWNDGQYLSPASRNAALLHCDSSFMAKPFLMGNMSQSRCLSAKLICLERHPDSRIRYRYSRSCRRTVEYLHDLVHKKNLTVHTASILRGFGTIM